MWGVMLSAEADLGELQLRALQEVAEQVDLEEQRAEGLLVVDTERVARDPGDGSAFG